jgi:hypothetical protein
MAIAAPKLIGLLVGTVAATAFALLVGLLLQARSHANRVVEVSWPALQVERQAKILDTNDRLRMSAVLRREDACMTQSPSGRDMGPLWKTAQHSRPTTPSEDRQVIATVEQHCLTQQLDEVAAANPAGARALAAWLLDHGFSLPEEYAAVAQADSVALASLALR